jgi:hypothetical protein
MDTGISTVRNLLWILLSITLLSAASNFYVAKELSRNSDEMALLRKYLETQAMGNLMTQSEELQKRMDALNQTAGGMDAKMKEAQDAFVVRLQQELPKMMDNYIQSRMPGLERRGQRELGKRGVNIPQP